MLAARGLIPADRNHRLRLKSIGGEEAPGDEITPAEKTNLAEFGRLLAAGAEVELPGDAAAVFDPASVFEEHRPWRLEARRALRALVKAGLAGAGELEASAASIGAPLLGETGPP